MNPQQAIPVPDDVPGDVLGHVVAALVMVLPAKRIREIGEQCARDADVLEGFARRRAGVYPIRGGGALYGERPEDRRSLEAARILRHYAQWFAGA